MKIRTKFIIVFFAALVNVLGMTFFFVGLIKKISDPIENDIPQSIDTVSKMLRIDGLASLIRLNDEILTQCARNYAFTGNKAWVQQYYEHEAELDDAIAQGVDESTIEIKPFFVILKNSNDLLCKLEHQSIDCVKNGESQKAISILDGKLYADEKAKYQFSLRQYFSGRGMQYDKAFESSVYTIRMAAKETADIAHHSLRLAVIVILTVSAILLFFGIYLLQTIVKPLKSLTNHVYEIAEGKLDQKVAVSSNDEIGELAKGFNEMTEKLAKSQQEIEERAEELGKVNVQMQYEIMVREQAEQEVKSAHLQLIQSEKLAGIGQLAAGVAHEINNPVGYVLGNSETLAEYFESIKELIGFYESKLTPDQIDDIKKRLDIEYILGDVGGLLKDNIGGLRRVVDIVANLKDFARVGQKNDQVEADIEEHLKSTLMVAKNEIKYYADIKTDFSHVSPVYCNIGEMNQVFLNIIVNAAQAIAEQHRASKGLITVATLEDDDSVYCSIADDGPGIKEENVKKIFEPFFTTKPVGKGTGLGLNIAWDIIVNRHKGEIGVDTELGKGTCFTIKLPKRRQ